MAANDVKMSCGPVTREKGVTSNPKDSKRKSRSRHKKAGDGSSSAPASDDGRNSPTVSVERYDADKKLTQKTKKAGESSSNALANDEGRKSPSVDKRSKHNAGEGSSNAPADDQDEEGMAEGMTEDTTRTAAEIPEYLRIITDIHKKVTRIKASMVLRLALHGKLGELGALFNSIQEENTRLKAKNRVLHEVKPQRSYASVTQTAAAAHRQLPQVIQKQKEDRRHTVFISSSEGKDAKEIQKILTTTVNPVSDKIRI